MARINYLDGLRGVAILLVLLFHLFSRWASLLPFDSIYSEIPFFKYGWLGVNLFFIISGFVILMSLEKSQGFTHFLSKRWLRLFPAMLVATLLLFTTAYFLPERPNGCPELLDTIPGLTFIEPSWISRFLRFNVNSLEGAFWSLYVEVKFYILFGADFFIFGRNIAITLIAAMFVIYILFSHLAVLMNINVFLYTKNYLFELSAPYYGWFVTGSLLYLYVTSKRLVTFILALLCGLFSALALGANMFLPAISVLVITFSIISFKRFQFLVANRFFLFLGLISYPLYLIHENALIGSIIKINKQFPHLPHYLLPVIPLVLIVFAAYIIAQYIEPAIRTYLYSLFNRIKSAFQHR